MMVSSAGFHAPPHQRGLALIELAFGLGLSAAIGAVIVTMLFQLDKSVTGGGARLALASSVIVASQWLARDTRKALSTSIPDGGEPRSSATFLWTDGGISVSCGYALNGTNLERSCDGFTHVIARGVSGLTFSRSGSVVTVEFYAFAGPDGSVLESVALRVAMRYG